MGIVVQLHLLPGLQRSASPCKRIIILPGDQANGKGKSQGGDRRSPLPCTLASSYLGVRVRAKGKGKSQGGDRRSPLPCTLASS